MKKQSLFAAIIFLLFCTTLKSQTTFLMGQSKTITTSSGIFYDDGGANGNVGDKNLITTFKAPSGFLEIYFTEFNIPPDAALKIYYGNNVNDKLCGVFKSGDKPWNFKSESITIEYIASPEKSPARGWRGVIQNSFSPKVMMPTMPESDCPYAIPICSNSTINTSANQYSNTGIVNDDAGSCYSGTGAGGSVWYSFTPQTNGLLDFAIAPTGGTDYDFVLWDITAGCSAKIELSCNYCLIQGTTGMNSTGTTNSEPASGVLFCQKINVSTAKKYAICINYYSGNNAGFQLTFKNEPGDVSIIDAIPPTITNGYTTNCVSGSLFHITFSEWVQCGTVIPANLTIPGHTITVTNDYCVGGKTNQADVTIAPPLAPGTYNLNGLNVLDMCGNPMNSNFSMVLGNPTVATLTPGGVTCKTTIYFLGIPIGYSYSPASQTLTANNTAGGPTTYQWSDGYTGPSNTVSPANTTTYTVTVSNGACATTLSTTVTVTPVPQFNPTASPASVCPGSPSTLTASNGSTYQFFNGSTAITGISSSPTTVVYPVANTTYTVVAYTANGCSASQNVTVNTLPPPTVSAGPSVGMCIGGSAVLNGTTNGTSYVWSPALGLTCTNCLTPTANPAGNTTYTLTATGANGCTAASTVAVVVQNGASVAAATTNPICTGSTDLISSVVLNAGTAPTYQWYLNGVAIPGATSATYTTPALSNNGNAYYLIVTPGGTGQCNNNLTYSNTVAVTVNACTNLTTAGSVVTNCTGTVFDDGGPSANYTETTGLFFATTKVTSIIINPGVPFALNFSAYAFGINATGPDDLKIYNCNTANCTTGLLGSYTSASANPGIVNIPNNNGARLVFTAKNPAGLGTTTAAGFGASWAVAALSCSATITGPSPIVAGSSGLVYTVTPVAGATYVWTVPPGCWITSGAGTNSITISSSPGSTGGTVTCTVVNACNPNCSASRQITVNPSALPIELVKFTGSCKNNIKTFEWTTASETNNDFFTVEKSRNGNEFLEMGKIKGQGNSTAPVNYKASFAGENAEYKYHRLVQTDFNRSESYSSVITVQCDTKYNNDVTLYPNPTDKTTSIKFNSPVDGQVQYVITDVFGRKIKSSDYFNVTNGNDIPVDIADMEAGIYFVKINQAGNPDSFSSLKLVKRK
jgi:hypothetical protein